MFSHLHRSLAPKATWKTKQQHHCNPDQSCPHFRVVRKVEHTLGLITSFPAVRFKRTLSLRFSPNSCKCVRSRFAYHNWKFLQFQWASVYSFTLSNLDCLKKCPIRQLRVLTLASTSSATKWVHRFFIFTSSLSLSFSRCNDRESLNLQSDGTCFCVQSWLQQFQKRKIQRKLTQTSQPVFAAVSAACFRVASVVSALPIVRSTGWLWRQVFVFVSRTNQGPLAEKLSTKTPHIPVAIGCRDPTARAKTWDYPASAWFADFSLSHNVSKLPTRTCVTGVFLRPLLVLGR